MSSSSLAADKYFEDIDIGEYIRFTVLGDVLTNFDEELNRLWLETLEIPYVVDKMMAKIDRVIAWATYPHDGDLTYSQPAENDPTTLENIDSTAKIIPLEVYKPDREPAPASIDTWARGIGPCPIHNIYNEIDNWLYFDLT